MAKYGVMFNRIRNQVKIIEGPVFPCTIDIAEARQFKFNSWCLPTHLKEKHRSIVKKMCILPADVKMPTNKLIIAKPLRWAGAWT